MVTNPNAVNWLSQVLLNYPRKIRRASYQTLLFASRTLGYLDEKSLLGEACMALHQRNRKAKKRELMLYVDGLDKKTVDVIVMPGINKIANLEGLDARVLFQETRNEGWPKHIQWDLYDFYKGETPLLRIYIPLDRKVVEIYEQIGLREGSIWNAIGAREATRKFQQAALQAKFDTAVEGSSFSGDASK